jgi:hypothetical protein
VTLAVLVQRTGQHLFTGTRFTLDEYGDAALHQAQCAAKSLAYLRVSVVGNIAFRKSGGCVGSGKRRVFVYGRHQRHLLLLYSS